MYDKSETCRSRNKLEIGVINDAMIEMAGALEAKAQLPLQMKLEG